MAPMVIDVRQCSEYDMGHITGALNIELGERNIWTACPENYPWSQSAPLGCGPPRPEVFCSATDVQVMDEAGTLAWIERGYPH